MPRLFRITGRSNDAGAGRDGVDAIWRRLAGKGWHAQHDAILEALGRFPGETLREGNSVGGPKKQTTRLVKVACADCGFHFRTSQQQIDRLGDEAACPACGDGTLTV